MTQITLKDRLRYRFDQLMSKGTIVLVVGLFLLSASVIAVTSMAAYLTGIVPPVQGHKASLIDIIWLSLMRTLDGGTMGMDTGSWSYLLCMLFITSAGILVVSTLTGLLVAGIEHKMSIMRKGHSFVVERDHVVLLGWSNQIFPILEELFCANVDNPHFRVVILAERDKVAMEDEIHFKLGRSIARRVVCRSGNPMEIHALSIVNLNASRSIIILTPENSGDPDSDVIKTILAITNHPHRAERRLHIVAAVRSPKNRSVAQMVGQDEVEVVLTNSLIARLIVQACRQDGLSILYQDILDFKGNNILFKEVPELVGKSFKQAAFAFENTSVLGLRHPEGQIRLNPAADTLLQRGDKLVVLSLDIHQVKLSHQQAHWDSEALVPLRQRSQSPSKTLILGWNHNTTTVINELDAYVAPGSQVHVVAEMPECAQKIQQQCQELQHLEPSFELGDTTDRDLLIRLLQDGYKDIMTMAYSDHLDLQRADAKTLLTLLHLRDLSNRAQQSLSITSEMLDIRNRELARIAQVNDFIVSDKLISLMMSQLAQDKALNVIFDELLSPEGVEIYLKPATDYVQMQGPVNFYTVLESAFRYREIAVGYKLKHLEHNPEQNYGIFLNPTKSELITFSAGDRIIVVAED